MLGIISLWLAALPLIAAFSTVPRRHVATPTLACRQQYPKLQHGSFELQEPIQATFDPFDLSPSTETERQTQSPIKTAGAIATFAAPLTLALTSTDKAVAATTFSTGDFNPATFSPVCPASDGIYRFLQGTTQAVVGDQNFVEYGPLIAGGLLRIRLELCVVESFFNEAVAPFIEKNGLSWILPLHETVETFLAGTIFSLASTFILVGSTKIVAVIITYFDAFLGAPARLFGGFFFDRARGKPVTLDVGFGPFKTRVVGPPEEEVTRETDLSNFQDANILSLFVILISGILKTGGELLKVRDVIVLCRYAEVLCW
jgi:hypothetical protein